MELIPMSKLAEMLNTQAKFQLRLDPEFYNMSIKERVAFIKEHSIHLNQEVNEMLYELPFFKPWKNYDGMSEADIEAAFEKARMECVDAWHFFMNIMLALGFSADNFYEMYMAKNKENHRRQDDGYTADVSYRDQYVEEVMHNG
jgi:dimeric dUTPase (all-alpha-NTP-PPase superfamily)